MTLRRAFYMTIIHISTRCTIYVHDLKALNSFEDYQRIVFSLKVLLSWNQRGILDELILLITIIPPLLQVDQ